MMKLKRGDQSHEGYKVSTIVYLLYFAFGRSMLTPMQIHANDTYGLRRSPIQYRSYNDKEDEDG